MENLMERSMKIRKEIEGKENLHSLLRSSLEKIKDKESEKLLRKKPKDIFNEMKENNEIRGNFTKLEFLKLKNEDLVIVITDIHGETEKLQAVLDYIQNKKNEIKGKIHLVSMGDIASEVGSENINVLFDLLKGDNNGDFNLHLLQGNVERDAPSVSDLYEKTKKTEKNIGALPAMTNLFRSLPNSLFLENGIMLNHSVLPLVNKKRFEEEGLEIYNKNADEIDKLGVREYSGVWATFDGERKESEYGGKKMFQLGIDTFQSILTTLNLKRILRGHDSNLIKKKAKNSGIHRLILEEGEVDTFHTSAKATDNFGIFAEITNNGDIKFKKI